MRLYFWGYIYSAVRSKSHKSRRISIENYFSPFFYFSVFSVFFPLSCILPRGEMYWWLLISCLLSFIFLSILHRHVFTLFENHRKSLIQHCERSELRQKLIKNAKNGPFGEFLKTWSLRSNSVTRQVNFKRTKIGEKCQNSNATFWVIFKQWMNKTLNCLPLPRFIYIVKHQVSRRGCVPGQRRPHV